MHKGWMNAGIHEKEVYKRNVFKCKTESTPPPINLSQFFYCL